MAPLSVKELIGEVAKRHNVLLGPNDPILVTLTLNELVVGGYVDRVEQALGESLDQLSGAQAQHIEAAREIASSIITRAAEYGAEQIHRAVDDLVGSLRAGLAADVAAARASAEAAEAARADAHKARQGSIYALVAAAVLVALALGLVVGRLI